MNTLTEQISEAVLRSADEVDMIFVPISSNMPPDIWGVRVFEHPSVSEDRFYLKKVGA